MTFLSFSVLLAAPDAVLMHARTIPAEQDGTKTARTSYVGVSKDTSAQLAPPARWDQRKADSQ